MQQAGALYQFPHGVPGFALLVAGGLTIIGAAYLLTASAGALGIYLGKKLENTATKKGIIHKTSKI